MGLLRNLAVVLVVSGPYLVIFNLKVLSSSYGVYCFANGVNVLRCCVSTTYTVQSDCITRSVILGCSMVVSLSFEYWEMVEWPCLWCHLPCCDFIWIAYITDLRYWPSSFWSDNLSYRVALRILLRYSMDEIDLIVQNLQLICWFHFWKSDEIH